MCGLEAGQCPLLRAFNALQRFNRRTSNRCGFVAAMLTGLRKRECDFYFLSGRAGSAELNVRLIEILKFQSETSASPRTFRSSPASRTHINVSCPYIYKNDKTVLNGNLIF